MAHAFTVVAGHTAPGASGVSWETVASVGGTIVVLMGGRVMADLSPQLQTAGLAPDTPVAVICQGTRPDQTVVRTTLDGLSSVSDLPSSPTTIVIGAVAAL